MIRITKKIIRLFNVLTIMTLVGCSHTNTKMMKTADHAQAVNSEVKILQSWASNTEDAARRSINAL